MSTFLTHLGTGVRWVCLRSSDQELEQRLRAGEVLNHSEATDLVARGRLRLVFQHAGGHELELHELSDGTQRLIGLASSYLWLVRSEGPIFLDELDRSLHAQLTRELIKLAYSACENGAQLIFTTHDTGLLDPSLLRRDAIWFVDKNLDGETRLWSLADFDPHQLDQLDAQAALAQGYLQGRFGAVPTGLMPIHLQEP